MNDDAEDDIQYDIDEYDVDDVVCRVCGGSIEKKGVEKSSSAEIHTLNRASDDSSRDILPRNLFPC